MVSAMLKLSHDGIAEDADLVSVWGRLAESRHSRSVSDAVLLAISDSVQACMELEARRMFGPIPEI